MLTNRTAFFILLLLLLQTMCKPEGRAYYIRILITFTIYYYRKNVKQTEQFSN